MPEGEVRFETDNQNEFVRGPEKSGFDLVGGMVQAGLVSTREEATYVMIGIVFFVLVIAGFFLFRSVGGGLPPPPPVAYSGSATSL